jgi:methionine-rich copper-binding protein CopC
MMLDIPSRRFAALIAAASLTFLLLPRSAAAHADLVTPTPADKSTMAQPVTEVSGVYSEAMTPAGSSLVVKDAGGATVAQGTVDPAADTRMVAKPVAPLGTGSYTVEWTSVATDGHVERGTWTFRVAVGAAASPSPVASASSSAVTLAPNVAATAVPSGAPAPSPSAAGGTTSGDSDVILPIIVALIILGVGAAYLLSRRDRPSDAT